MIADYRLAPEHSFPADVEDAIGAYRGLLAQAYRSGEISIGGESSGSGLTLSTLVALRETGEALPGASFLLSQWLDLCCTGETHETLKDADLTCTTASLHRTASQYLGSVDPHDPRVSALDADLSELPPLFVQVGGSEILLDDAGRVARRAGLHGTRATLEIWPEMQHAFQPAVGVFPEAHAAVGSLGRWLREPRG